MKNKGFTLVELLAVIVVLAVIAMIATPIILGVVNDSREGAIQRSVDGIYEAVEIDYSDRLSFVGTACYTYTNKNLVADDGNVTVPIKGSVSEAKAKAKVADGQVKVALHRAGKCYYRDSNSQVNTTEETEAACLARVGC